MSNIKVERYSDDRLSRQVWRFWFYDSHMTLYLDTYSRERRTTKRHGFKPELVWARTSHRRHGPQISLDEVPWPDDVVKEAEYHLQLSLSVKKEYRR